MIFHRGLAFPSRFMSPDSAHKNSGKGPVFHSEPMEGGAHWRKLMDVLGAAPQRPCMLPCLEDPDCVLPWAAWVRNGAAARKTGPVSSPGSSNCPGLLDSSLL